MEREVGCSPKKDKMQNGDDHSDSRQRRLAEKSLCDIGGLPLLFIWIGHF